MTILRFSNTDHRLIGAADNAISDTVKFWFYLTFLIPSYTCSVFVLYYLIVNGKLRFTLHNHSIILVLVIGIVYEMTIYPWMLYYYHYRGVWHRSLIFCTIWSFIDWGLYYTQTILFAWTTIERHILIFHNQWVSTKTRRFLIHYVPLVLLSSYCLVYYVILDFFPPCINSYYDTSMICVTLCFTNIYALYMWDTLVHQALPTLIIVTFSIALLVRVSWHKHRIGQSIQWRKHRKMTIQMLYISLLYLIFAFPMTLMNLLYLCVLPRSIGMHFMQYLLFLNYSMILLYPFACLLSLPQLRHKFIDKFRCTRQRVQPLSLMLRK
jgi:hypothetical protein